MNRRDALMRVATLMGATLTLPALSDTLAASAAAREASGKPLLLTAEQDALVAEMAEVIIPTTSTPGAKAAKVNELIDVLLKDCYKPADQKRFLDGLAHTNELSRNAYGKSFVQLQPEQRIDVMKKLEAEAKAQREAARKAVEGGNNQVDVQIPKEQLNATPFFAMLKDMTLLGYFTSEVGATQALEYVPVPGRYDGCVTMKPGQKAWAI